MLYSRFHDTTRFDLDIKGLTEKTTAQEIKQKKYGQWGDKLLPVSNCLRNFKD